MTTDTRGARNWSGLGQAYADTFAHLCAGTIPALLEETSPTSGDDVVEVGCGTGLLAQRLEQTGARVVLTEPDEDMRALTAARLGHVPVDAGLPDLPFDDASFDVVLANFVVNHVGDPRAGVRELTRVARPGGRVAFTVWPSTPTAQGTLFKDVLEHAEATPPTFDVLPPELDFERSADGCTDLLRDAGLDDLRVREVPCSWRIRPDDFWRGLEAGIGGIGKALLQQDEPTRRRMRAAYDELSAPLLDGEELVLPSTALLAVGTA